MKGAALVVTAIALMVSPAERITCQEVEKPLGPWASYLTKGGDPKSPCCNGVRALKNNIPYTADRRAAFDCIMQVASRSHNIKVDAAATFPGKRGVLIGVPIHTGIDCNGYLLDPVFI